MRGSIFWATVPWSAYLSIHRESSRVRSGLRRAGTVRCGFSHGPHFVERLCTGRDRAVGGRCRRRRRPVNASCRGRSSAWNAGLDSAGGFIYTPNQYFSGVDSFQYVANDGLADGNAATVTINVQHVSQAPVGTAGTVGITAATSYTLPHRPISASPIPTIPPRTFSPRLRLRPCPRQAAWPCPASRLSRASSSARPTLLRATWCSRRPTRWAAPIPA